MDAIRYHIARSFLRARNARHVREFPQIACFSYDLITLYIHLDGQYERDELEFLARHIFPTLPDRAVCLDVGANIGNHALHFSRHFDQVIALEPHPRTFALLSYNAGLVGNVTPLNLGASRRAEVVTVTQDALNIAATSVGSAGRAGAADAARKAGVQVRFDLRRIDDLPELADCGPISFLKMDVEGHERAALEGAAGLLARHRPLIAIEVLRDDVAGGTTEAVEFLRAQGYRHFYELRPGGLSGRMPRRLYKLTRTLVSLVTGRRPAKALRLAEVAALEPRSYLMLLCATEPLTPAP